MVLGAGESCSDMDLPFTRLPVGVHAACVFARQEHGDVPDEEFGVLVLRAVIGVSSSSGEVPSSIDAMAANAAAFIKALGLTEVDLLGFSLGGLVAQKLTLAEPKLVRRLVLVGTGPRSGRECRR